MVNIRGLVRPRMAVVLVLSGLGISGCLIGLLFADPLLAKVPLIIIGVSSWLAPVLITVNYNGMVRSLQNSLKMERTKTELKEVQKAIIASVEISRDKASRHEYHQERSLARIENEVREVAMLSHCAEISSANPAIDIMFVTSNGAGLGHVTRLLAVAESLPKGRRYELLTLSKAYKKVATPGLTVHYFPSSEAAGESHQRWNRVFREYLVSLLKARRPKVLVFDGTWVYTGLTDVCRVLGISLVWVQRGMWKRHVDEASIQRHAAAKVVDHVIIPGDYAETEIVDLGPGIQPHYVGPIVRTDPEELLSRQDACRALGLDPNLRYALLNLGGGALNDTNSIAYAVLTGIKRTSSETCPVQVVSPLADEECTLPGLVRVSGYPVMTRVRAFDYMVAASGYNSAQEAAHLGVPTVLVPNEKTKTDDQVRRAQGLSNRGLALMATGEEEINEALQKIEDPTCRESLIARLDSISKSSGAVEAAEVVEQILKNADWPRQARTIDGRAGLGTGGL